MSGVNGQGPAQAEAQAQDAPNAGNDWRDFLIQRAEWVVSREPLSSSFYDQLMDLEARYEELSDEELKYHNLLWRIKTDYDFMYSFYRAYHNIPALEDE
jgi:hypothetical protein